MVLRLLVRQIPRTIKISRYPTSRLYISTCGHKLLLLHRSVTATPQTSITPNTKHYSSSESTTISIVTYEEVKQLPRHPEKLLIDVREPKELQETGQIPTSINIPLGQVAMELASGVKQDAFKGKYGREKPQQITEIIFYCRSGKRAQNAAEIAKSLGYENSKNYLGSWTEWAEKEGFAK